MKKFTRLLLLAAAVVTVGLLASSCLINGDTKIRYVWETKQQPNILSISASYRDVDDWLNEVWYPYYHDVPLDVSHTPKYNGSTEIPDNIYSSTLKSTKYKGVYLPITYGSYTAVCTVVDPRHRDTVDIVANYRIKDYVYVSGDPSTTYYELGFDVGYFLSDDKILPDLWWYLDEYDNSREQPGLTKTPASSASKPFLKVVEKEDVTYLVFRRPSKG